MAKPRASVYETITAQILEIMDREGLAPWVKPWRDASGSPYPYNGKTGRAYSGINVMLCSAECHRRRYAHNEWWTAAQVAGIKGASVKVGEVPRFLSILFAKPVKVEESQEAPGKPKPKAKPTPADKPAEGGEDSEDSEKVRILTVLHDIYNRDQCVGLPPPRFVGPPLPDLPPDARAESLIKGNKNLPRIRHVRGEQAYYTPALDAITMPLRGQFSDLAAYYSTLFHEATHSTGHPSRLNRSGISKMGKFGDPVYSKEELVAEMGAAFLCALAGITNAQQTMQSAAYLKHWRDAIAKDSRLVIQAAAMASKAADLIVDGAPAWVDAMPTAAPKPPPVDALVNVQDPADLAADLRATLGENAPVHGTMQTKNWTGDEGLPFEYRKRVNAAPWVDAAKRVGIAPGQLDRIAAALEAGKRAGNGKAAQFIAARVDDIRAQARERERSMAGGEIPAGPGASQADLDAFADYAALSNPRKKSPKARKSRRNPGPVALMGLGLLVGLGVILPDGKRVEITTTAARWLAWRADTRDLVIVAAGKAARAASKAAAAAHAEFHGQAPTGQVHTEIPEARKCCRRVGLLEWVKYNPGTIASRKGSDDYRHFFGDRGERGHGAEVGPRPYYPVTFMPDLWASPDGNALQIRRRQSNRYTVRDWILA